MAVDHPGREMQGGESREGRHVAALLFKTSYVSTVN